MANRSCRGHLARVWLRFSVFPGQVGGSLCLVQSAAGLSRAGSSRCSGLRRLKGLRTTAMLRRRRQARRTTFWGDSLWGNREPELQLWATLSMMHAREPNKTSNQKGEG